MEDISKEEDMSNIYEFEAVIKRRTWTRLILKSPSPCHIIGIRKEHQSQNRQAIRGYHQSDHQGGRK